jgi:CRISPR type I-D-associated protein Csc3/Cas10d
MLDMKEDDLGNIQQCVDRYVVFYHGGFETHSILKPIDIVAKAIISSPLEIEEEDLLWQIQGEIKNWLDRVRSRQATGRAMCWGKDIPAKEEPAVREFVTYFYQQVFKTYCQGERGELRSRLNRFKDGCEAYYVHLMQRLREVAEPEPEKEPVA